MWGLPTYIIFFGGVPFLFLREIQSRGFALRAFWIGIGLTFVLDLLLELPLLYADGGLYQYYAADGNPPMEIFRFPVYWLFINTTGPILCAAILYAIPGYFRGWRAPFLVLLPAAADAACSIVVGLPVYSALHAPGATELVRWGAALLTCAIGLSSSTHSPAGSCTPSASVSSSISESERGTVGARPRAGSPWRRATT